MCLPFRHDYDWIQCTEHPNYKCRMGICKKCLKVNLQVIQVPEYHKFGSKQYLINTQVIKDQ